MKTDKKKANKKSEVIFVGQSRTGKDGLMIYVSSELKDDLRKLAAEDGRSMSNLIVRILNVYVKEHKDVLEACTDTN